jgi:peptide/nickel transport system substrate-binding protein
VTRSRRALSLAGAAILTLGLAACGEGERDNSGGGEGGSASGSWTLGTTETVTAMDPAGSYDIGSWNMQYSLFEQLMAIPAGESEPVGDAAESCEYDDPQTITCTLREGLTFSNGNELTSSDVRFSLERNLQIADPNGSAVLLGAIKDPDRDALADGAVETPDDQTVVFNLNQPDLTFLKILSSATASIVDEETFPAESLLEDEQVVGSGPFMLSEYSASKQAVLEANPEYDGERAPASETVFVQFFNDAAPLRNAIASSQLDVAWRTLSPTDLTSLEDAGDVEVLRGEGSEFRYWVWQLGTDVGGDKAVRQAVAQVIDREAIAQNAYDGTVEPSYSIVPPGFGGQKDSFAEAYGEGPDVEAARQTLREAGVKTPVRLTLGYTPTHYGPNTVDEARELAGQLEDSGLFEVSTEDAEWEEYQTLYKQNAYDLFVLGWYPDFLDADNYLSPFLRDGGFYQNNYSSQEVNSLLDEELGETDEATREEQIGELQDIVAEDVPLIPSWNGQNVAVAVPEMEGVEGSLDPTYIFRLWEISKG